MPTLDAAVEPPSNVYDSAAEQSAAIQSLLKLHSILKVRTQLAGMRSRPTTILRRRCLEVDEFLDRYYAANQPVVLLGLFDGSKAMSSWTPEYLRTRFGDEKIEVMMDRQSDPLYEINCLSHKKTISFAEYIQLILTGGETNDYYLVANNNLLSRERFTALFDEFQWPHVLDASLRHERTFLWIGPAGTVTPLHHDECNVLLVQVNGRKLIRMISPDFTPYVYNRTGVFSEVNVEAPDYTRCPLFQYVRVSELVLHPGEALFIPVAWWHHVRSLDISISLSFTNFCFSNNFDIVSPKPL